MTNIKPHSVDVSWDAQSGVSSYTVQYTLALQDGQLAVCTPGTPSTAYSGSASTTGASTKIIVKGSGNNMLRPFTTYFITVTAVSANVSTAPSTAIPVTTAQSGTILFWFLSF